MPPLLKVSETPNFQFGWSNLCLVLRWVALKSRLGGIPHAATPLFCKVFGEFVLPARIPPDRLIGDPTPFNKGVFGTGKLFGKFLFDGAAADQPRKKSMASMRQKPARRA